MSFDPDAQAHIDAKIAVDGFMWPHVQTAINRFVVGCKADPSPFAGVSNWMAIKAGCLMAGMQSLAGAFVPLRGGDLTNFGFVQADYHPLLGLKGDGTSKCIGSGRFLFDDPADNCHVAVHITEEDRVVSASPCYISTGRSGGDMGIQKIAWRPRGTSLAGQNNVGIGTIGIRRTSNETFDYFRWGETGTVGRVPREGTNKEFFVFRSGGLNEYTDARLSFYSIGEAVDLVSLDARVTQFMRDIQMPNRRGFPMSRLVN